MMWMNFMILLLLFFVREENKFELYDDKMNKIDDCVYTFEKVEFI